MFRELRVFSKGALAGFALIAFAPTAEAGITINRDGIFLTEPNATVSRQATTADRARFGSPAGGFRRSGRSGFFATPRDQTLPFNGRNAFGPEGRRHDDRIRAERGPRLPEDSIFTGAISSWFN